MADQYIGEIRYFTYLRGAPEGWLLCDGSTQQISQYEALGALLSSTYGGDGSTTFGLPDLRGRVGIGVGVGAPLASQTGQETVSLTGNQMPQHNHLINASQNSAGSPGTNPANQVFASNVALYTVQSPPDYSTMQNNAIGWAGQGLPHQNCAPTLTLVPCIAWDGIYPVQNN